MVKCLHASCCSAEHFSLPFQSRHRNLFETRFRKPTQPSVSTHVQWIEPRPPGGASTTCPSSSVITCPDEIERMITVELCEGTPLNGSPTVCAPNSPRRPSDPLFPPENAVSHLLCVSDFLFLLLFFSFSATALGVSGAFLAPAVLFFVPKLMQLSYRRYERPRCCNMWIKRARHR
jgi:hypothetical protein